MHVLTTRTEQKILASMKRVKLGNDFRSNVSLGATVEPVKLTKEQEETPAFSLLLVKISCFPSSFSFRLQYNNCMLKSTTC